MLNHKHSTQCVRTFVICNITTKALKSTAKPSNDLIPRIKDLGTFEIKTQTRMHLSVSVLCKIVPDILSGEIPIAFFRRALTLH